MQGQGLDSLINKKVDAYRGNPQALENRYLQNKQLEDLLALQKIKSDKEAAKRQMRMNVPQNPDTIAAQREQEVLAMTKEEMAQQAAGLMRQRGIRQQKNLQRAARGKRPPVMAAKGGLMPLPRPAMKLSGGGILGFNEGTEDPIQAPRMAANTSATTDSTDTDNFLLDNAGGIAAALGIAVDQVRQRIQAGDGSKLFNALKSVVGGRAKFAKGIIDKGINLFKRRAPVKEKDIGNKPISVDKSNVASVTEFSPSRIAVGALGAGAGADALLGENEESTDIQKAPPQGDDVDALVDAALSGGRKETEEDKISGLMAQMEGLTATPDIGKGISRTMVTDAMPKGFTGTLESLAGADPDARSKQAQEDFYKDVDRTGIGQALTAKAEDIDDYNKNIYKRMLPENMTDDQRRAGLEAFRRGVAAGGSGRTGMVAMNKFLESADNAGRAALQKSYNNYLGRIKTDLDIVKGASDVKGKIFEAITKQRAEAMKSQVELGSANISAYNDQAAIEATREDSKLARDIEILKTKIANEINKLQTAFNKKEYNLEVVKTINELAGKIKEQIKFSFPEAYEIAGEAKQKLIDNPSYEPTDIEQNAMSSVNAMEQAVNSQLGVTDILDNIATDLTQQ